MTTESQTNGRDDRHRGPARTSPYPISRLAPPTDLVEVAKEIEKADIMMGAVVSNKLQVIVDQIRHLQEQAVAILAQTKRDADLHRAAAAFKKKPGTVYHLYARAEDSLYFSMLSPADWGEPPHPFRGSYRLEVDMSWTPLDQIPERDASAAVIEQCRSGSLA